MEILVGIALIVFSYFLASEEERGPLQVVGLWILALTILAITSLVGVWFFVIR